MSSAKHVEIAWRHGEGSGEGFALASRSSATPTMRTRHPVASSARHAHDAFRPRTASSLDVLA